MRVLDAPIPHLDVTQGPHELIMQQEINVLSMVQDFDVGCTALGFATILRLARINSLQNAETSEIV